MVDNLEDLDYAIKQAQAHKGPFLIHARVLKEENVLPMVAPGTSLSDTIYYPENEFNPNLEERKAKAGYVSVQ